MAYKKLPLIVVCGCSVDEGKPAFWVLDTSDSRLFVIPEKSRVDSIVDGLFDFLGKNLSDDIVFKTTVLSKRGEQILKYILKKIELASC